MITAVNLALKRLIREPFLPWFVLYLFLNIFFRGGGGTNEYSRYATLRAMSSQHTFQIDDFKEWTIDWSQTPDGHYYSNKAPGPMLLAFPIFYPLDLITKFDKKETYTNKMISDGKEVKIRSKIPGPTTRAIVTLLTQVIPLGIICWLIGTLFLSQGISFAAVSFFIISTLFGSTSSIFTNVFMGHGVSAFLILATQYNFFKKNFLWMGFFLGLSLLCDYSFALLIPLFAFNLIWIEKKNPKAFLHFILGGIFPGLLWIWYHQSCFGSFLSIAPHFQNPLFKDMAQEKNNLWGLFSINFRPSIYNELLFGAKRGLLFTQPWVLLALFLPMLNLKDIKFMKIENFINNNISLFGLFLLLIMNANFGGWHSGHAAGPRYLSLIFPLFSLMVTLNYDSLPRFLHYLLWISLIPALVLYALIKGSTQLPPIEPLWRFLYNYMMDQPGNMGLFRASLTLALFVIAACLSIKIEKQRLK